MVGHPAKASLGRCLAPLDGTRPSENDHGKTGMGKSLAPAWWTTLDLQAVRAIRKPRKL